MRPLAPAVLALASLLCLLPGCGEPPPDPVVETRALEEAWGRLREAVLQSDDEAFFEMHSRRAREKAVTVFPSVRTRYLGSPQEEKAAFLAMYQVTEQEFLQGEPRDLVARMMPWETGWRARKEMFRASRVKDVRLNDVTRPDGTVEREGVVILDISAFLSPEEAEAVPEAYLPRIVFVKDPEGWRRRDFLSSAAPAPRPEKVKNGDR